MSRGILSVVYARPTRDDLTAEALHHACVCLLEDGCDQILATFITDTVPTLERRMKKLVELREQDALGGGRAAVRMGGDAVARVGLGRGGGFAAGGGAGGDKKRVDLVVGIATALQVQHLGAEVEFVLAVGAMPHLAGDDARVAEALAEVLDGAFGAGQHLGQLDVVGPQGG